MKLQHWLIVGILAGFAAFVIVLGCTQQTPAEPGSDAGIVEASAGEIEAAPARKKAKKRKPGATSYSTRLSAVEGVETDARGFVHMVYNPQTSQLRFAVQGFDIEGAVEAWICIERFGLQEFAPLFSALPSSSAGLGESVQNGGAFSGSGLIVSGVLTDEDLPDDWTLADFAKYELNGNTAWVKVYTYANPGGEIEGELRRTTRTVKKKIPPKKK